MKVRCIRLLSPEGLPQSSSKWLTVGALYDVLTIEISKNGMWLIRLLGDGGDEVALFPVAAFEVVCSQLPPSWVANWSDGGAFFQLGPEAWAHSQFWEQFYDRDPAALQVFEAEFAAIKACNELHHMK